MSTFAGRIHWVFGNGDGDRFAIAGIAAEPGSSLSLHREIHRLTACWSRLLHERQCPPAAAEIRGC